MNCVFKQGDNDHRNINECIIEVKRKDLNNNINNESKKKSGSLDTNFVEGVINIEELEDKELQTNNKKSRRNA